MYICIYVYMYVYIYICVCVYIYIYTYVQRSATSHLTPPAPCPPFLELVAVLPTGSCFGASRKGKYVKCEAQAKAEADRSQPRTGSPQTLTQR